MEYSHNECLSLTQERYPLPERYPLMDQVAEIYARMDHAYREAARTYGFVCRGCDDNCCRSLFYHHTLGEYLYVMIGFHALEPELQAACLTRARLAAPSGRRHDGFPLGGMCPLNHNQLCLIYAHRPMICRLHGLPHTIHYPGRPVLHGRGCNQFYKDCPQANYRPFDRTPSYRHMADLEQQIRRELEFKARIKLTIADMILTGVQL